MSFTPEQAAIDLEKEFIRLRYKSVSADDIVFLDELPDTADAIAKLGNFTMLIAAREAGLLDSRDNQDYFWRLTSSRKAMFLLMKKRELKARGKLDV